MNYQTYSREVTVAEDIARKAGEIMLQYFDAEQQVVTKSDNSPVTIADKLINDLVIEELSAAFPEDGIIGEEKSTAEYGMGRKWFCDPIDGTAGYIWGTPTAMFSLGLVVNGVPVVGVAYDPFLKKMYTGVRGEGSYMNDKRLSVVTDVAVVDVPRVAVSGSVHNIYQLKYLRALEDAGYKLTTFSGAVYKCCLVARGKFFAYIEHGVNAHDFAAAQVIVEEAGGKITGIKGETLDYTKPFKGGVVSNGVVHEQIVQIINS